VRQTILARTLLRVKLVALPSEISLSAAKLREHVFQEAAQAIPRILWLVVAFTDSVGILHAARRVLI